MKTVQMTLDDHLLESVDALTEQTGETRSAFIRRALHAELQRHHNEAAESAHRQSFQEKPDDDVWQPTHRAWGDE